MSATTNSFNFSLGVIEDFFDTVPETLVFIFFLIILLSLTCGVCYTIYSTVLRFIDRRRKSIENKAKHNTILAREKRKLEDLKFEISVHGEIRKAFLEFPESSDIEESIKNAEDRLRLLIKILKSCVEGMGNEEYYFIDWYNEEGVCQSEKYYIHESITNYIDELEKRIKDNTLLQKIRESKVGQKNNQTDLSEDNQVKKVRNFVVEDSIDSLDPKS